MGIILLICNTMEKKCKNCLAGTEVVIGEVYCARYRIAVSSLFSCAKFEESYTAFPFERNTIIDKK